jgi:hypothetical protein
MAIATFIRHHPITVPGPAELLNTIAIFLLDYLKPSVVPELAQLFEGESRIPRTNKRH